MQPLCSRVLESVLAVVPVASPLQLSIFSCLAYVPPVPSNFLRATRSYMYVQGVQIPRYGLGISSGAGAVDRGPWTVDRAVDLGVPKLASSRRMTRPRCCAAAKVGDREGGVHRRWVPAYLHAR